MNIKTEAMADEQRNDGNINDDRKSFDKKNGWLWRSNKH